MVRLVTKIKDFGENIPKIHIPKIYYEQLLEKAISYDLWLHTHISDNEIKIIKHSRKSLLFFQSTTFLKNKSHNELFDVTMGSFDGAEQQNSTQNTGLYRDDGLTAILIATC